MDKLQDFPGLVPYPLIFHDAEEGVVGVTLPRKVGKAKAGEYTFTEAYCMEAGCDCRRVSLLVVNEKRKQVATIDFGFDPAEPMAGPFLNEFAKQSAAAEDLLRVFVDLINDNPEWLKGMYRHYKQVRKKVDGRAYRGKPFPKPGSAWRVVKPPEEDEGLLADLQELLESAVDATPGGRRRRKKREALQGELFPEAVVSDDMAAFVERYRQLVRSEGFVMHRELQSELRRYLLDHEEAGEELARLLLEFFARQEQDEEGVDAALRTLFDVMDILRIELERDRPGANRRMEAWQTALARHVFAAETEGELRAAVTHTLLQARVEILPVLHAADTERMYVEGEAADTLASMTPEEAMEGLYASLEEMGLDSPFELFDAFLQLTAVGDPGVQVGLCAGMLTADNPLIRDAGALMLFHPQAEVREGAARELAAIDGQLLTGETLRRLIIARNWFPEALRRQIDQAVTNARKARVDCAPLPQRVAMAVHASGVDGAGAQAFQVVVPDGLGMFSCSIMLKKGAGVADAFLIPLSGKRELKELLAMMRSETGAAESTPAYLEQRLCQALADGAAQGKVPNHWLAAIAERLGRDQWKAIPFDPRAELAMLEQTLEERGGRRTEEAARRKALTASAEWPDTQPFAHSWFEDDVEVDRVVEKALGKRRRLDVDKCIDAILKKVLQPRRSQWLERLVLAALWLKAAKKPPVPWEQMAHVAAAVADETLPLEEIPLMVMIAGHSFGAWMGRQEG